MGTAISRGRGVPSRSRRVTADRPRRLGECNWFTALAVPPPSALCAICLDDEHADDRTFVELSCGNHHVFHQDCVEAYMVACITPKCPTCRQEFLPQGTFENVPQRTVADAAYGQEQSTFENVPSATI